MIVFTIRFLPSHTAWRPSLTISLGLWGIRGEHCSFILLSTKHSTSLRTTPPYRCWSAHYSTYTFNFVHQAYTLPFCTTLPFHNAVGLRLGNADDSTCLPACLRGINLLSASTLLIFSFTVSSLAPHFLVSDHHHASLTDLSGSVAPLPTHRGVVKYQYLVCT